MARIPSLHDVKQTTITSTKTGTKRFATIFNKKQKTTTRHSVNGTDTQMRYLGEGLADLGGHVLDAVPLL
jgi:hypothetical protein